MRDIVKSRLLAKAAHPEELTKEIDKVNQGLVFQNQIAKMASGVYYKEKYDLDY